MEGKTFAFRKLLNVAKLVQQQLGIQSRAWCKKDRAAEGHGSDRRLPEQPASYSKWKPASPKAQLCELGPRQGDVGRKLNPISSQLARYLREISQVSPFASYVMCRPSLRITTVPSRSVRIVRAPALASDASTSALG